jgi:hypothetical protein
MAGMGRCFRGMGQPHGMPTGTSCAVSAALAMPGSRAATGAIGSARPPAQDATVSLVAPRLTARSLCDLHGAAVIWTFAVCRSSHLHLTGMEDHRR